MGKANKKRIRKKIFFKTMLAITVILSILILWVGIDVIIGASIKSAPRKAEKDYDFTSFNEILWLGNNPNEINPDFDYKFSDLNEQMVLDAIDPLCEYMSYRYDCSDFRAIRLVKMLYSTRDTLLPLSDDNKIENKIKDALTSFKFWITSPGKDSMCYYSENHQINFAAIEYLSGLAFQNANFSIDNKNGNEHKEIARKRIMDWLEMRFSYGFSECYSQNYYPVDLVALSMLVQYGDKNDNELMEKCRMILDILFLDYALQMYDYSFMTTAGRAYAPNNNYWDGETKYIIDYVWDNAEDFYYKKQMGNLSSLVIDMLESRDENNLPFYEVPRAIIEIGKDNNKIVKTSTGLNFDEMQEENLIGESDKQMMFQLGMGAISNPEVIQNTLDYMNKYNLYSNNFLSSFKYTNIKLFQYLGLMPWLTKTINPITNGFANRRYNVYTYSTDYYKLSTNQNYYPGSFGSQQTIMTASMPNGISIYTTNPMDGGRTPGYWAGYGYAPHAVQSENITMMLYDIEKENITFAQNKCLPYSHTYFPEADFDEINIDGKYAFGKVNDSYIALIGTNELEYLDRDESRLEDFEYKTTKRFDLVQRGQKHGWIYEMSSKAQEGSFEQFISRIKSNEISFKNENELAYISNNNNMNVVFNGDFTINGNIINTEYQRLESEYGNINRKSEDYNINCNGFSLQINFDNLEREYN